MSFEPPATDVAILRKCAQPLAQRRVSARPPSGAAQAQREASSAALAGGDWMSPLTPTENEVAAVKDTRSFQDLKLAFWRTGHTQMPLTPSSQNE